MDLHASLSWDPPNFGNTPPHALLQLPHAGMQLPGSTLNTTSAQKRPLAARLSHSSMSSLTFSKVEASEPHDGLP
jgi:hypothetical protein